MLDSQMTARIFKDMTDDA